VVLIAKLNSHSIIELTLVDGIVMLRWDIIILGSKVLLVHPVFLLILLILVEVVGVVIISELNGHTIVEISLINGAVVLLWKVFVSFSKRLLAIPLLLLSILILVEGL